MPKGISGCLDCGEIDLDCAACDGCAGKSPMVACVKIASSGPGGDENLGGDNS